MKSLYRRRLSTRADRKLLSNVRSRTDIRVPCPSLSGTSVTCKFCCLSASPTSTMSTRARPAAWEAPAADFNLARSDSGRRRLNSSATGLDAITSPSSPMRKTASSYRCNASDETERDTELPVRVFSDTDLSLISGPARFSAMYRAPQLATSF